MTTDSRVIARVAIGVAIGLVVLVRIGPSTPIRAQDSRGRSAEHHADPCVHLPNHPGNAGNAKGIAKHCPPVGSSSGVAKGDFNGDGFADLPIGEAGDHLGSSLYWRSGHRPDVSGFHPVAASDVGGGW